MDYITVVLIEEKEVSLLDCSIRNGGEVEILNKNQWNPAKYLTDLNGQRLIEEISRRVRNHWKSKDKTPVCVAVSLPGTLQNEHKLHSSSRLGIREPVDFSSILGDKLSTDCYIFHDTECLIEGELRHGNYFPEDEPSSLVYIFVDEGIGSEIIIDGKKYSGMGTAGLLGRLIVQPEGQYFPKLRSTGSLEVYSSRPWVSQKLVEVYHSEMEKKGSILPDDAEYSKFRQALKTASDGNDWTQIQIDRIAAGLNDNDPIALHVIDNAARYLGYAINSVITIINPKIIILGGAMITELSLFRQKAVSYARQFSWPTAWNKTEIHISPNDRDMQVYGTVLLCQSFIKKQS